MQGRPKNALVICLFVFLFVIIGSGLHLTPVGAFLAALSGTPLQVFACYRHSRAVIEAEHIPQTNSADKAVRKNSGSGKRRAIARGLKDEIRGISANQNKSHRVESRWMR